MLSRILCLAVLFGAALPAFGQALEIKAGSPLTIETFSVRAVVDEGVALVDVDQTFRNGTDQVQEGTYRFRLPENAVVHSFSMWIEGKEKHGRVLEAGQARRIYERIVRSKKDPALLEEIGWRAFKVSVFPIPARDTVRIRLVYAHVVHDDLGLRTLEIPMPEGVPVGVADVLVSVRDKQGLAVLDCPTHADAQVLHDEVMGAVQWSREGFVPQGPLTVRSAPAVKGVGMALLAHKLEESPEGTFLVRVVPRLDDVPEVPRDVVFVVDRSGSMQGQKMEQARAALLHGLSTLKKHDRFSIIAFSSGTQLLTNAGLVPANAVWLQKARLFAKRLTASGGTNIDLALEEATSLRDASPDRLFVLSFLTDGQPTVGEKRPGKIVDNYRERSGGEIRLFAFGVGNGVKDFLLTQLSKVSHGAAEYVREDEDLEVKLSAFFDKVESPILTDVSIEVIGTDVQVLSTEPERLPDVFRGTAVVMAGRYTGSGPVLLRLTGRIGPQPVVVTLSAELPAAAGSRPHVAQLWARMRIDRLLDELRLHGMVAEIRAEIVRLGLRYQVVTPYTSFLIVEDDTHIPDDAELARVPEPSAAPVAAGGSGGTKSTSIHAFGKGSGQSGPRQGASGADPGDAVAPDSREPSDPPPAPEAGGPSSPGGEYRGPAGESPDGGAPSAGGGNIGGPSSGGGGDSGGASSGPAAGGPSAPTTGGVGRPSSAKDRRDYTWWAFWWKFNGAAVRGDDVRLAPALSPDVVRDTVIPALRSVALSGDSNWNVRAEAQRALQRLGDDGDHVRGLAMRMLLGEPLDGEASFHRMSGSFAARLLIDGAPMTGAERSGLIRVLADAGRGGSRVRDFAALTLGLGGTDVNGDTLAALLAAVADTKRSRAAIIFALGLLGDERATPHLLSALAERKWGDVALSDIELVYVVDALGRIGSPGQTRGHALGRGAVVAELEKALTAKGRSQIAAIVRRAIPAALARLVPRVGPPEQRRIVGVLEVAFAGKRDRSTADFAAIALGRVAASVDVSPPARVRARKALLRRWERRSREPAAFAALALGIAAAGPEGDGIAVLLRAAPGGREPPDTRAAAAIALGMVRDAASVDALVSVARDNGVNQELRIRLAESLATIGADPAADPAAVLVGLRAAYDAVPDGRVRRAFSDALAMLGDAARLEAAVRLFETGGDSASRLSSAAASLGQHGGDAAARRLAAVVADDAGIHPHVTRAMAARALGRMALIADPRRSIATDFPYRAYVATIWEFMDWR